MAQTPPMTTATAILVFINGDRADHIRPNHLTYFYQTKTNQVLN